MAIFSAASFLVSFPEPTAALIFLMTALYLLFGFPFFLLPNSFFRMAIFSAASFLVSFPAPTAALIFLMTALLFNLALAGCFFDICAFFVSFASTLVIPPTSKAAAAITPHVCIFILCLFVSLVLTLLSRIRVIRSRSEPPFAAIALGGLEIRKSSILVSAWPWRRPIQARTANPPGRRRFESRQQIPQRGLFVHSICRTQEDPPYPEHRRWHR